MPPIKRNSQGVEIFDFKPPKSKREIKDSRKCTVTAPCVHFRPERIERRRKDEL
jgi:hypothetical protein